MLERAKGPKRHEEVDDLRWVMADPRGRRVLRRCLVAAGMYETVFRPVPMVPQDQWPTYNGAVRDYGQQLSDEMMSCAPQGFQLMNSDAILAKQMERAKSEDKAKEEDNG
jgi:hypothetical protein